MKLIQLEDLINLREDGLEVRENNASLWKLHHKDRKGIYYRNINRIILYTSTIVNNDDYNVTLMHELYHAFDSKLNETETEDLALLTNADYPALVDFAKQLFL